MSRLEEIEARLQRVPGAELTGFPPADIRALLDVVKAVKVLESAEQMLESHRGGDSWQLLKERQRHVNDARWRLFRALEAFDRLAAQVKQQ